MDHGLIDQKMTSRKWWRPETSQQPTLFTLLLEFLLQTSTNISPVCQSEATPVTPSVYLACFREIHFGNLVTDKFIERARSYLQYVHPELKLHDKRVCAVGIHFRYTDTKWLSSECLYDVHVQTYPGMTPRTYDLERTCL